MRRGFTLIELMVASLLLGMIVSLLTMIFNQTAISWRTGVASVVNLNATREELGKVHAVRDDILPGLGHDDVKPNAKTDTRPLEYRTVSLWKKNGNNELRKYPERAYEILSDVPFTIGEAQKGMSKNVVGKGQDANDKIGFSVGVRSLGPDGKPDTEDDISTWPEEID